MDICFVRILTKVVNNHPNVWFLFDSVLSLFNSHSIRFSITLLLFGLVVKLDYSYLIRFRKKHYSHTPICYAKFFCMPCFSFRLLPPFFYFFLLFSLPLKPFRARLCCSWWEWPSAVVGLQWLHVQSAEFCQVLCASCEKDRCVPVLHGRSLLIVPPSLYQSSR